jgi:hypothetical protein
MANLFAVRFTRLTIAEDRGSIHNTWMRQEVHGRIVRAKPIVQNATSPSFQRHRTVSSGLAICSNSNAS